MMLMLSSVYETNKINPIEFTIELKLITIHIHIVYIKTGLPQIYIIQSSLKGWCGIEVGSSTTKLMYFV